ncbi:MAG TPA: amino acid adenylation domain-containing protein, partial [Segetibacter sp.]
PMLAEAEQQQLLGLNNIEVAYPKDQTIVSLFEKQALKTPQATAVVYDGEKLSYEQLNTKANQLAHYLRQRGVKEDTLVPVYIERSHQLMVGILGIMKAGAAYVPIDTDFPADRISYMIKDSGSSIVISSKASSAKLETAEPDTDIIVIDGTVFNEQPTTNPQTLLAPHHLAYVIYTSGSTGTPKGVMIEHRSLADYVFGLNQQIQVDQCTSFALVSSIATDLGNTVIYSSLVFGGALHLFSKEAVSNIEYLHSYFKTNTIDCLKIVPSHWKALSLDEALLLPKKLLVFGGEALQSELVANIRQTGSKCTVVNHYGPTETTIGKLLHITEANRTYNNTIPIGKPFSNTQVYVLSKELQLTPQGVPGQLYIAGDGVGRGYLNNEELTKAKFIKNPYSQEETSLMYGTGDLVKYLPDGNIEFIGRADDQVKIRGYRVELGEIESILQQSELVSQGVVLAREDKQGNKRLVGYVVAEDGWFDREGILSYLKEKLPEYMVPSALVELESLPLTANGKVDRKALPDPEATAQAGDKYVAPGNDAEVRLTAIWQDVLEEEKIGVNDNFFELGGHSLLAVRLISAIRKEFAVEIPISHVFDYPTIALLAGQIGNSVDSLSSSNSRTYQSLIPLKVEGSKIPLYIVCGTGGTVFTFKKFVDMLEPGQPVYGLQQPNIDDITNFPTTIESIAAKYIEEMLLQNPDGPYALAGHCLGGIIAFEMAHQLTEMGKKVSLLALLDTLLHTAQRREVKEEKKLFDIPKAIKKSFSSLFFKISFETYLWKKHTKQAIKYKADSLRHMSNKFNRNVLGFKNEDIGMEAFKELSKVYKFALNNYIPRYYPGTITVIYATDHYYFFDRTNDVRFRKIKLNDSIKNAWKNYADSVTFYEVKGEHSQFFEEQYGGKELAKLLQQELKSKNADINNN